MSQGQLCPFLSLSFVFASLGLTILEVACNMELPHGGEGWQQLRQGYLPPEFTAGEWGSRNGFSACGREWLPTGLLSSCGFGWCPGVPDMALPRGQVFLLSCVLSLS